MDTRDKQPRHILALACLRIHSSRGLMSAVTKTARLAAGIVLGVISFTNSAHALNVYLNSCACKTTADFVNSAASTAVDQQKAGMYTLISSSVARTAFISVQGHWVAAQGQWILISAVPVDAAGNSLAGQSESAQEAIYTATDINVMMVNRSDPIVTIGLQLPGFFSHDDAEIAAAYFNISVNQASSLGYGDTVTITWGDGSGIVAVYTVVWLNDATHDGSHTLANFALKFKSATQHGNPINRNGTPVNSNPPAGSSSGTAEVAGFGPGAGWTFTGVGDLPNPGVTITVGDPIPGDSIPSTDTKLL